MSSFVFRVPISDGGPPIDASANDASNPVHSSEDPLFSIPDYINHDATHSSSTSPAPEPNAIGSFEYDIQHNYTLRWPNWDAMRHWMKAESSEKSIEFLKKETPAPHPGITA
jgi:hypothetical protein